MLKKLFPDSRPFERVLGYLLLGSLTLLVLLFTVIIHVKFTGRREGFYLLKRADGPLLELKDDLYLNEGNRVILAFDMQYPGSTLSRLFSTHKPGEAYLYYEWDKRDGSGFVRNFLPDGSRIRTYFSRFEDDQNNYVHGLFVGGGHPARVRAPKELNATGMAYNDGTRWYHIWCTANEVIDSGKVMEEQLYPYKWKYLGSEVYSASDKELILKSSHKAVLDGVPLRMDRTATFRAGETYFILSVKITNTGNSGISFYYSYGDEPWVGNYGSSKGNVGWTKDRLIKTTYWLDTQKYSFSGFFDCGNELVGEGHNYTNMSDFIEWFGPHRPSVYFSNSSDDFPAVDDRRPLGSNERFMCLQWGPETLEPGRSIAYTMAIGMAKYDPAVGLPVKPEVKLESLP